MMIQWPQMTARVRAHRTRPPFLYPLLASYSSFPVQYKLLANPYDVLRLPLIQLSFACVVLYPRNITSPPPPDAPERAATLVVLC
jgi:hypothetical protein